MSETEIKVCGNCGGLYCPNGGMFAGTPCKCVARQAYSPFIKPLEAMMNGIDNVRDGKDALKASLKLGEENTSWPAHTFCKYHLEGEGDWAQYGCPVCAAGKENKASVEWHNKCIELEKKLKVAKEALNQISSLAHTYNDRSEAMTRACISAVCMNALSSPESVEENTYPRKRTDSEKEALFYMVQAERDQAHNEVKELKAENEKLLKLNWENTQLTSKLSVKLDVAKNAFSWCQEVSTGLISGAYLKDTRLDQLHGIKSHCSEALSSLESVEEKQPSRNPLQLEPTAEECLEWIQENKSRVDCFTNYVEVWTVKGDLYEGKTALEAIRNAMKQTKDK